MKLRNKVNIGDFRSIFRIIAIIDSPEDFKFVEFSFLKKEGSQGGGIWGRVFCLKCHVV